jgi:hypothetical protein
VPGDLGTEIADAAREAFAYAMSRGSAFVAGMAAVGALIAWRYLPAHESHTHELVTR